MAKVELKRPVVEEIAANIEGAQSVVLVSYSGINVDADTKLRKDLREAGVVYKVYKNTMMNFAFKGTEFEPLCEHLNGPNAIAISKEDATAPARELDSLIKKFQKMTLKGGVVEGQFYDQEGIQAVAKIPSRDELIAKFMGSIQSPVSKFVRTLQAIADEKAE